MNNVPKPLFQSLAATLALPLLALCLTACDMGSVDSTSAVVSDNSGTIYNFSGLYMHPDIDRNSTNDPPGLVYPNSEGRRPSGEIITFLRLLQYGSVLEAYDSAGLTWYGNISAMQGGTASFTLSGRTTVGQSVEVAGTMSYASQQSTMDATWIEPSYYGNLSAKATVTPANTNSPVTGLSISPSSVTLSSNKTTQAFTASGGSGSYTWSVSNSSLGSVNPTTGISTTYTSTKVSGANIVTVTDSLGTSKTATATY